MSKTGPKVTNRISNPATTNIKRPAMEPVWIFSVVWRRTQDEKVDLGIWDLGYFEKFSNIFKHFQLHSHALKAGIARNLFRYCTSNFMCSLFEPLSYQPFISVHVRAMSAFTQCKTIPHQSALPSILLIVDSARLK